MFRAGICVIHIWKPTIFVPAFAIRPILIGHGTFSALGVVNESLPYILSTTHGNEVIMAWVVSLVGDKSE